MLYPAFLSQSLRKDIFNVSCWGLSAVSAAWSQICRITPIYLTVPLGRPTIQCFLQEPLCDHFCSQRKCMYMDRSSQTLSLADLFPWIFPSHRLFPLLRVQQCYSRKVSLSLCCSVYNLHSLSWKSLLLFQYLWNYCDDWEIPQSWNYLITTTTQ